MGAFTRLTTLLYTTGTTLHQIGVMRPFKEWLKLETSRAGCGLPITTRLARSVHLLLNDG
jgi:hypothetical protein